MNYDYLMYMAFMNLIFDVWYLMVLLQYWKNDFVILFMIFMYIVYLLYICFNCMNKNHRQVASGHNNISN